MKKIIFMVTVAACLAAPVSAARQLSASELKGAGLKRSGKIVISNDDHSIRVSQRNKEVLKIRSSRAASRKTVRHSAPAAVSPRHATARRLDSNVPAALAPIIQEAANRHGLDPRLLAAVARRESRFRPNAVSPVGAQGVMQLMPRTAKWLGVEDSFDPRQNIFGGAKYLRMMLDQFDGNVDLSLAAYNAGPGAVKKHRGIPPYRETRQYVAAIRSDYQSAIR